MVEDFMIAKCSLKVVTRELLVVDLFFNDVIRSWI